MFSSFSSRNNEPAQNLFLVLGSGRNGSTLLAKLMNTSNEVFLPPEQYAFPYIVLKYRLLGWFLNWTSFVSHSINQIIKNSQHWEISEQGLKSAETALQKKTQPVDILIELSRSYALDNNKSPRLFGDQSPSMTVMHEVVLRELRGSKKIFLIRHPLDTILSYRSLKDNPASKAQYAIWKWNNAVRAFMYLQQAEPENVLLIKYEDLVADTDKVMQRIENFLQISDLDHWRNYLSDDSDLLKTKDVNYHQNLNKPISQNSVGKWKKNLSRAEQRDYWATVKAYAEHFGYSAELVD